MMTVSQKPEKKEASKPSIAVFYPSFEGGGAESVGLWILEALKPKYRVTLLTLFPLDLQRLNLAYGTQLSAENIIVKSILPGGLKRSFKLLIVNNRSMKKLFNHVFIRQFKKQAQDYDLVLSAYNATDLGKKGI